MRLWSVHPKYLDTKGLLAAWREGLLAQKILQGKTRGYRNHPQLERFKSQSSPAAAIAAYLKAIAEEAGRRGYRFDETKIAASPMRARIRCTEGQLEFEWRHLMSKLKRRDPVRHRAGSSLARPEPHPLFRIVKGGVESWEKDSNAFPLADPPRR